MKKLLSLFICLLAATSVLHGDDAPLFPFVLPWDDASPGITNISGLLEKPAGGHGFVIAKDGHLYSGEKRFRIFGVNTVFGANFPTHEAAEKIAARMAKFGINCIRFHHMDNHAVPGGIWSADMKTIDPGQLDKLDYFIAQLKKNGIYADLNLHVSREYPDMPKWKRMPGYYKGVDNFYTPMIAMQHDYARQLLTHVNPYTKTAYIDEPAVAIIEINNENGLTSEWWGESLDPMPDVYREEFGKLWNTWLGKKYPSEAELKKAWNTGEEAAGAEMLKESGFEKNAGPDGAWVLEQLDGAKADAARDGDSLHITVPKEEGINAGWHIQLVQSGISFSKDRHYTVGFRARSDKSRKITVAISQAHAPWSRLWSATVQLDTDWQDFHYTFQPDATEENARVVFSNLAVAKGDYWFANASLHPGGVVGLHDTEHKDSMPVFLKSEFGARTLPAQTDWMAFLYDTESDYWTGMQRFLKEDLKAHSLIVGSATGFTPPSIQAKLDVVDVHAYWQHPHFPHKSWDFKDWYVPNLPMAGVPDGGTLPGLAGRRVAGKPLICTEYNESAPNTHSSEAFLLLDAYAALQDWDGVFVFAYSHRHDDWDSQRICSFFDLDQHPTKLVTLPAAVSLFLRGDVARAKNVVTVPVSWNEAIHKSLQYGPWWEMNSFGHEKQEALRSRVEFDVNPGSRTSMTLSGNNTYPSLTPGPTSLKISPAPASVVISDTDELTWNSEKSFVTINTPRNKAFIGKIPEKAVALDGVTIELGKNMQDWAAITVTAMDNLSIQSSRHILITATGYAENTGMRWTSPEKKALIDGDWGKAPSLVEGIPAKITLPFTAAGTKAWALDEKGQRREPLEIRKSGNHSVLEIGPASHTLWYEVETGGK